MYVIKSDLINNLSYVNVYRKKAIETALIRVSSLLLFHILFEKFSKSNCPSTNDGVGLRKFSVNISFSSLVFYLVLVK